MIDDGLTPKKRASLVGDFFRRYGDPPQPVDLTKSVFEEALLPESHAVTEPVPVLRFFTAEGEARQYVPEAFRKHLRT